MYRKYLTALIVSLGFAFQATHAAVFKDVQKPIQSTVIADNQSSFDKAFNQQKRSQSKTRANRDQMIKGVTSIKSTPSQSFLAEQNQRFSRLLQSIFSQT